jgi:hypothetical protein
MSSTVGKNNLTSVNNVALDCELLKKDMPLDHAQNVLMLKTT